MVVNVGGGGLKEDGLPWRRIGCKMSVELKKRRAF